MVPRELLAQVDRALDEIGSGRFHTEWVQEQKAGKPNMQRLWQQVLAHPPAQSEAKLESLRALVARPYEGEGR